FVAGVLVDRTLARSHGERRRPGPHPCRRIVDGELVTDRVRIHALETLDETQVRSRSPVVRFVRKVGRLHDERVALPATPRIAEPLADRSAEMWTTVQRDHSSVVDHFMGDRHVTGRLNNLNIVVVQARKACGRQPPGDASLERAAVLGTVNAPTLAARGPAHHRSLLAPAGQRPNYRV